jgi:hypothetical protein
MRITKPDSNEFLVIVFSDSRDVAKRLDGKGLPLGLKKDGEPLELERISLSRI